MSFTLLSVTAIVYIFSLRSWREPIWRISFVRNPLLLIACGTGLLLQLAAVYAPPLQHFFHTVPLLALDWLLIIVIALSFLGLAEWIKALSPQMHPRRSMR
jgi:Ca2+-transporting ATPase